MKVKTVMSLAIIIEATMTGGGMKEALGITVTTGAITVMTGTIIVMPGTITVTTGIIMARRGILGWTKIFMTGLITKILTGGN